MLRQALDAEEGRKKREQEQAAQAQAAAQAAAYSEATGLESSGNNNNIAGGYGATGTTGVQQQQRGWVDDDEEQRRYLIDHEDDEDDDDDDDDDDEEDDDDEDYDDDDWNDGDGESAFSNAAYEMLKSTWHNIKSCFLLVANVENLWDSPEMSDDDNYRRMRQQLDGGGGSPSSMSLQSSTSPYQQWHPSYQPPHQQQHSRYYHSTNNAAPSTSRSSHHHRRRSYFVVLFWFIILALSYTTERSTFKILVDQSGPFRLFSAIMVTLSHAIMLLLGMLIHGLFMQHGQFSMEPLGIPFVDVGLMALLDTIQLVLAFLSAYFVTPTTTVILVQFTFPLTALIAQFVNPDGRCSCRRSINAYDDEMDMNMREEGNSSRPSPQTGPSNMNSNNDCSGNNNTGGANGGVNNSNVGNNNGIVLPVPEGTPLPNCGGLSAEHLAGSIIITVAVILAILPSLYSIINPAFFVYADPVPIRTSINTLVYAASCIPGAASQIYKEHVFLQHKQPVNMHYLNLLLSILQFIIASLLAPLLYGLQGLASTGANHWTELYPSMDMKQNFVDGIYCYLGLLSESDAESKYYDSASCTDDDNNWLTPKTPFSLCLCNAFSIIVIGIAVDKICNAGATKAMYRGISVGIILSVILMFLYNSQIPLYSYGPFFDLLHVICLFVLIIGTEVYHRVTLQGATFETVYPEVDNVYAE